MVPGSTHESHAPVHVLLQQVPWTQWPLAHSASFAHGPAGCGRAQRPFRHA
jgi:hypothetical protein